MVPLVKVDQHKIALTFVNYLASLDIEAEVVEQQGAYVICCQPQHVEQARMLFEEFAQSPYHPKYQQAAWQHGSVAAASSPTGSNEFVSRFISHGGLVTLTIFALCWLSFIGGLLGWKYSIFTSLQFYSELSVSYLITEPQRLLGPAFLHFSWLHIVFNTMWWWQLGGDIEARLGKGVLLQLFFVSAIVSNVAQYLVSGPNFGGLSGVVYAVLGFVWWMSWLRPDKGLRLNNAIVGFMLIWLVLGFIDFLPVNMANTAHLAGLVSGCVLALFQAKLKR